MQYQLYYEIKGLPRFQRFVHKLGKTATSRGFTRSIGVGGGLYVKKHFRHLDKTEPNKLGGKRTHFWEKAGRLTQARMTKDGTAMAVFTTQIGVRQQILGGPIVPKKAKWLTIPITAEAHGHRARDSYWQRFGGLDFETVYGKNAKSNLFLVDEHGEAHYVLRKFVNQKPHPQFMPDIKATTEHALAAGFKFLRIMIHKDLGGKGGSSSKSPGSGSGGLKSSLLGQAAVGRRSPSNHQPGLI